MVFLHRRCAGCVCTCGGIHDVSVHGSTLRGERQGRSSTRRGNTANGSTYTFGFFFFFIFFFILFYSQGRTTVWIDPPFWFPSPLFSPLLTRSAPYLHPTPPFPVPLPPFLFPAIGSHSTHDTISRPRDKNKEDIQSVLTTRPSQISLAPSSKHFELTRYIFSQTYHERRIYEYT